MLMMKKWLISAVLMCIGLYPFTGLASQTTPIKDAPSTVTPKKEKKDVKEGMEVKEAIEKEIKIAAQQLPSAETFATSGIVIFLDESEKKISVISDELLSALDQKAGPIIASTSLFEAIINTPDMSALIKQLREHIAKNKDAVEENKELMERIKKYEELQEYFKKITQKTNELFHGKKELTAQEIVEKLNKEFPHSPIDPTQDLNMTSAIRRQNFVWNAQDWIIKIVDPAHKLLLLIPKAYKNVLYPIDLSQYKPSPQKPESLTEIEYQIGLKIDHMETIKDPSTAFQEGKKPEFADYFLPSLWNTKRENLRSKDPKERNINSSDIFVSRAEYEQAKNKYTMQKWAIYMSGHGSPNEMSVSMSINDFNSCLDFFNTRNSVVLLVYITCFAIGTNVDLIYKTEKQLPKTYAYTIVAEGVTEAVTTAFPRPLLQDFTLKSLNLKTKQLAAGKIPDFDVFIKNVTAKGPIDIIEAVQPLFELGLQKFIPTGQEIITVPQVRVAGREWFNIGDTKNKSARLGNIFAKTCTKVDIAKYFSKKGIVPTYYFMDAATIPCELVLTFNQKQKPVFIPMAKISSAEPMFYYIKKIAAPHLSLVDIIKVFTDGLPDDYYPTLWIDEIEINNAGSLLKDVKTPLRVSDFVIQVVQPQAEQMEEEEKAKKEEEEKNPPKLEKRIFDVYFTYNNKAYKVSSKALEKPAIEQIGNDYRDYYLKAFKNNFEKIGQYKEESKKMQQLEIGSSPQK